MLKCLSGIHHMPYFRVDRVDEPCVYCSTDKLKAKISRLVKVGDKIFYGYLNRRICDKHHLDLCISEWEEAKKCQ